MWYWIIFCTVLSFLGLIILCYRVLFDTDKKWEGNIGISLVYAGILLLPGAVCFVEEPKEPTALDVYRGKTTLQITYQDSIPIDSVVVFKDNIKRL